MRTKQIILLVVIVVALAGAGIFAYMTFSSSPVTPVAGEVQTGGIILPQGTKLDFEKVNKFNETGRTFQYPSATPADTGLQLNEIISQ